MASIPHTGGGQSPLTAERVRDLIVLGVAEHRDVAAVRTRPSIYRDRLAVEVIDGARQAWRVHVLLEPRQAVAR